MSNEAEDHVIPPMTDPLGKHWEQPPRSDILVDDTHAVMSPSTLRRLYEYSSSIPSGVYNGKMWSSCPGGIWWLNWWGPGPEPNTCWHHGRKILLT